jgi:hypothetical protein
MPSFLSSSFDTLLMVTVVYPLAGCAVPVCALGKTVEDWVSPESGELELELAGKGR